MFRPAVGRLVQSGKLPFVEYDAEPLLNEVLENGNLTVSLNPGCISGAQHVIIAIGTPVDRYLNPETRQFLEFIRSIKQYLDPSQILIIRSSVYPRICEQIVDVLGGEEVWHLAYCPERIVQGYAVRELGKLPQIVAGFTEHAIKEASQLFEKISSKIIRTTMGEAELVKLFSNSWRYIQFAIANQFFMMAGDLGEDYDRIREIMTDGYDRAKGLPSAGFAAGPCLLKDTMQLSAFYDSRFLLGQAAMNVNEGLPKYIVNNLKQEFDLGQKTVGILGMAFKGDVDDIRDSLSYKLGKILRFEGATVLYSDEFATDPSFVPKEKIVNDAEIIIVATNHSAYRELKFKEPTKVIDLWGITHG